MSTHQPPPAGICFHYLLVHILWNECWSCQVAQQPWTGEASHGYYTCLYFHNINRALGYYCVYFLNRISNTYVLCFQKSLLSGHWFIVQRLLDLLKWLFGCSYTVHHCRQYVSFDVISFKVVYACFQNYSKRVQISNTRIFHRLSFISDSSLTCRILISD